MVNAFKNKLSCAKDIWLQRSMFEKEKRKGNPVRNKKINESRADLNVNSASKTKKKENCPDNTKYMHYKHAYIQM